MSFVNSNMGLSYKNIGYTQQISFTNGTANLPDGTNLFAEGDELSIQTIPAGTPPTSTYTKGWITKSMKNYIEVKGSSGAFVPSVNGTYIVKVIRSGRRNMQTMEMANITTMVNPLGGVRSNVYQRVISTKAVEYENSWNINCECLNPGSIANANPYILGTLGNWRVKHNYEYISPRSQTNANGNSNIRSDGFFTNYSPFYKNVGGKWKTNQQGWIYTSEVTDVSPTGQELENRDALGRYSSASFGFNQTLATAVAMNSKYNEHGYQSFEDIVYTCTPDKHFQWQDLSTQGGSNAGIGSAAAHTGKNSVSVSFIYPTPSTGEFGIMKPISTDCTRPNQCPGGFTFKTAKLRYEIEGGLPPYTLEVQKIQGDGNILLSADGLGFSVAPNPSNSTSFKCSVNLIDQKGCVYTKLIQWPYNN